MTLHELGHKSDFTPEGEEPEMIFPSLHLGKEEVKALGLKDARVGQEMVMEAVVRVTSVSEDEKMDGDHERRVTLDVREADVSLKHASDHERAERIFGSS